MTIADTELGTFFTRSPGWHWPPCDVTMRPFHRIRTGKGNSAGKHFVKRDAQGVKITTGIDRPIRSPSLFGRHVGQRSGDEFGRFGRLSLAWKAGSDSESREPDLSSCGVNQDIGRLHVFVDQLSLV